MRGTLYNKPLAERLGARGHDGTSRLEVLASKLEVGSRGVLAAPQLQGHSRDRTYSHSRVGSDGVSHP